MYASIEEFNQAPNAEVIDVIKVWAPIDEWAEAILENRPYSSVEELEQFADRTARAWALDDVMAAIATHAQLGKKPEGKDASSAHSRKEQSSMGDLQTSTQERLLELQAEYLDKFGHIFLIRAAGRDANQILAALEQRLTRTPEEEQSTTADELRQIALLRLDQQFGDANDA